MSNNMSLGLREQMESASTDLDDSTEGATKETKKAELRHVRHRPRIGPPGSLVRADRGRVGLIPLGGLCQLRI